MDVRCSFWNRDAMVGSASLCGLGPAAGDAIDPDAVTRQPNARMRSRPVAARLGEQLGVRVVFRDGTTTFVEAIRRTLPTPTSGPTLATHLLLG